MSKKIMGSVFAVVALCVAMTVYAEKEEAKKAELACPVSGKPINKEVSVDYKGGKVYMCCPGCPGAFEKNTAKFAAKANHQLYATGQAKLVKCPLAGRELNKETAIDVAGTKVCFCCNNCKAKATKAEGDAQIDLIFGDAAFEKGFEIVKKKDS
jgi:YHS domain-containing protein